MTPPLLLTYFYYRVSSVFFYSRLSFCSLPRVLRRTLSKTLECTKTNRVNQSLLSCSGPAVVCVRVSLAVDTTIPLWSTHETPFPRSTVVKVPVTSTEDDLTDGVGRRLSLTRHGISGSRQYCLGT